jgi:glycolate dehydrogenase FAD-binding subunit
MTSTASSTVRRPTSVDEAAAVLHDSRGGVLFRGAGTKMSWAGRPHDPDLVLETAALDQLLEHNPADMTASVQAGMPLRALQDRLAEAGQWLALDPPTEPDGATVGGLLATGESGPRRLRYGALRDLVIGLTLVLPDGTVAHAGGRVIKNVAGYDLSKLVSGSLGTLGLIAEVVLRLHPLPETTATVVVPSSVQEATARSLALLAGPLEPAAVDWVGDPRGGGPPGRLAVRFEGTTAGVAAQTAALREQLDGATPQALADAEEAALWREYAHAHRPESGQSTAFAGTLPSRLTDVATALAGAADAAGVDVSLASHAALGLHTARFSGPPAQQAAAFEQWRREVVAVGGTVALRDRPAEVDAEIDPLGPAPSSVGLLRAVKARLDPDGRCAPGRLAPWL